MFRARPGLALALGFASIFPSCLGSVFPSSLIKFACPLVLALTRSTWRHVHASASLACRVAFVVMPRIAWVRRQRAGANPGGPPLLDLWLLCWSMAGGVVRCFIDATFGHSLGPGVSTRGVHSTPSRAIAWGSPAN